MPLIGTAGHVDHGKSTLIHALTGRNPDRLAEEKRRGLTIDLGFAWADLGDGTVASFVDVPGHERYLRNMLAGVDGLDLALLVVDAGEGWMPQTEEHLAVLDLLDVPAGVVALTKADLVDRDSLREVGEVIVDKLRGTFLEGAPVVPVSSPGGQGLAELRRTLARLSRDLPPRPLRCPRLWIDRSFTIAGAGTVVTGSLLGGEVSAGDQVVIYPAGSTARVRSVQSHEERITTARPGTRVALGLAGIDVDDVSRGDMIGRPGEWRTTRSFVARFRLARYLDELPLKGAYQLHMGTAIVNATIVRIAGDRVSMRIDNPLPMAMGDRFILRDTGRRLVVAGGRVVDPSPVKGSLGAEIEEGAPPDDRADQLLEVRGLDRLEHLTADSGGGHPISGVVVDDLAVSARWLASIVADCERAVAAEHAANPMRDGVPLATLAGSLGLPRPVVDEAVRRSGSLEARGANVANSGHHADLDDDAKDAWDRAKAALAGGLSVPVVSELALGPELLHLLIRRGELVKVSDDLVYLPDQIASITEAVGRLDPPFGVGEFKEAIGVSRKYSMPLLEWLDANGYTIRRPEGRLAGPALSGGQ